MKRLMIYLMIVMGITAFLVGCGKEAAVTEEKGGSEISYVEMAVPEGVPVLMYHKVGPDEDNDAVIDEKLFRAQMQYLKDHDYHPISLDELGQYLAKGSPLPIRPVVLTFDDGYKDTYTIVYPVLKELGFVGAVFINPGDIGERLTWQEVKEMHENGIIIANHGYLHLEMDELTEEAQRNNILNAQKALKNQLGIENRWFCYPYGEHNEFTKEELARQGIVGAFKMNGGWSHYGEDIYAINRVWIGNSVTIEEFAKRISSDKNK